MKNRLEAVQNLRTTKTAPAATDIFQYVIKVKWRLFAGNLLQGTERLSRAAWSWSAIRETVEAGPEARPSAPTVNKVITCRAAEFQNQE